jgi:hypothetical protein
MAVGPQTAMGHSGRRGPRRLVVNVGDSHKGPLNNQGRPAYLRKKQTQMNLKTRVR